MVQWETQNKGKRTFPPLSTNDGRRGENVKISNKEKTHNDNVEEEEAEIVRTSKMNRSEFK